MTDSKTTGARRRVKMTIEFSVPADRNEVDAATDLYYAIVNAHQAEYTNTKPEPSRAYLFEGWRLDRQT